MKDKYDLYMEAALQPVIEPDLELNRKIITESMKSTGKGKKKLIYGFAKVAVAVIALVVVAPTVVIAAEQIVEKYFVTEHTISTGNPEYVDDASIATAAAEEEEVTVEQLEDEEGNSSVNWTSKHVECVNGFATNTYYDYEYYETGIADSGLDNWFNTTYKTRSAYYVLIETDDYTVKSVSAEFAYHDGTFCVEQSVMSGNVISDCANSIALQNTGNVRTYESISGKQFKLVDEIRKNGDTETVTTYVMIAYDQYFGYLSFKGLSETDIYEILDTVCINADID